MTSMKLIRNCRAQVGIGTLIIFIAMVLVAAVAASVLIQTSGVLQQKAQSTGKEATREVSSNIDIESVEGQRSGTNSSSTDDDTFSDTIDMLTLRCSLKVGSEPVDLNQVVITITDGDSVHDLMYIEGTLDTNATNTTDGNFSSSSSDRLTTYRLLVDSLTTIQVPYPDAIIGSDATYVNKTSAGAVHLGYNASKATTGDYAGKYFMRADMFFIAEELRDEDSSFSLNNPMMNTGDLVKIILLTAPSDTCTNTTTLADLKDVDPRVGEADLTIETRTTVAINLVPEGGANTLIEFVTPSSFGTKQNIGLYP
ncbi:MAG: archaellin/type IV pilin N-terminal domain-containing protein [Euryarchaeota archaeon]|nr:archaellin/type IV pilin N-terminal domain-containing protein [Euryarchaeota archaeon]